jgi:hypothetical protein
VQACCLLWVSSAFGDITSVIGSETGDEDNLFAVMNLDVTGEEKALYPVARWLVVKGFQVSRDRHL